MAVLISKVVRSNSSERVDEGYSSGYHTATRTNVNKSTHPYGLDTNISGGKASGHLPGEETREVGIVKTVTTVMERDSDEETCGGYQLSTRSLAKDFPSCDSTVPCPP
jgi:hypothetical protein